jgi:hypothetical protein
MSNIGCCVGEGKNVGFWRFQWFGDQPFSMLFPDLFAKESFKEVMIADRVHGNGSDRTWLWNWQQHLTDREAQQLIELQELLHGFSINTSIEDRWKWKDGPMGLFSVKSCYARLIEDRPFEELDANVEAAITKLWKTDAPSKALVLGWRLLLDRLPTRSALNHRGILLNPNELLCEFCSLHVEDSGHLFLSCQFSKGIWDAIAKWVGKNIVTGTACWHHFLSFGNLVSLKKGGDRVSRLIWLAAMWSIWKHRNNVIFNGATPDATTLLDEIKYVAWLWLSSRFGRRSNFSFLFWCLDPLGCISSIL